MSTLPIDFKMLASRGAATLNFAAGDVIFKQGDVGRELFIIQSGTVKIVQGDRLLETLSDHGVFGELAIIDSAPRSATAVAVSDVKLVSISEDQFLFLLSNAPQFVLNIMRLLTRRLRERERENELLNVDAIIGSVAHEIRQPLAAIATNSSAALRFLERTPPDTDEVRDALRRISKDSYRANDVFAGIRALFSRVDVGRESIDINTLASEVLQSLRNEMMEHSVTANSEFASGLPLFDGNRGQLRQVILNVTQNSIEAMSVTRHRKRMLQMTSKRSGQNAIALKIQDSGVGIEPEQLDKIFDAFVTTKKAGWG